MPCRECLCFRAFPCEGGRVGGWSGVTERNRTNPIGRDELGKVLCFDAVIRGLRSVTLASILQRINRGQGKTNALNMVANIWVHVCMERRPKTTEA